jgi:hypothetical protein
MIAHIDIGLAFLEVLMPDKFITNKREYAENP